MKRPWWDIEHCTIHRELNIDSSCGSIVIWCRALVWFQLNRNTCGRSCYQLAQKYKIACCTFQRWPLLDGQHYYVSIRSIRTMNLREFFKAISFFPKIFRKNDLRGKSLKMLTNISWTVCWRLFTGRALPSTTIGLCDLGSQGIVR